MSYVKYCLVCGTQFAAQRPTAAFCSDVCRQRNHREKARISRRADLALQSIHHLAAAVIETSHSRRAWNELLLVINYAKQVHAEVEFGRPITDWTELPTLADITLDDVPVAAKPPID